MRKQTVWLVSAIIVLLGFTGCNALFGSSSSPPSYITWYVRAIGSPTTTHLVFFFSYDPPSGLVASDFSLQGSGGGATTATIGELSGTGTTRTLTLSNVTAGTVHITIHRPRVSEETRSVTLSGPPPPITWTATPVGTLTTAAIDFTFSRSLQTLNAADITITPGTGSATVGSLTGTGTTRTLTLSNVTAGTVGFPLIGMGLPAGRKRSRSLEPRLFWCQQELPSRNNFRGYGVLVRPVIITLSN